MKQDKVYNRPWVVFSIFQSINTIWAKRNYGLKKFLGRIFFLKNLSQKIIYFRKKNLVKNDFGQRNKNRINYAL